MPQRLLPALWAALAVVVSVDARALDADRADVQAFAAEVAERHGFAADELLRLLGQAESRPSILSAIARPAEKARPWHEYRAIFLTERRVARGAETGRAQSEALGRAAARGVPAEVLLAITGVETFYGEVTGRHRVLDALATLAFDYPPRSPFFRKELEQFLVMSREESLDALEPTGSYAGAMGIPQFMPSSFRAYAVDGDGDGRRNLWASWDDVFASVANYLLAHGWRSGEPVMAPADAADADLAAVLLRLAGRDGPEYRVGFTNFYAITRYNRSQMYASAVADLAGALAGATSTAPAAPARPAAEATAPAWSTGPAPPRGP